MVDYCLMKEPLIHYYQFGEKSKSNPCGLVCIWKSIDHQVEIESLTVGLCMVPEEKEEEEE